MVDLDSISNINIGQMASNTASGAYDVMMVILTLVIVVGVLGIIYYILQYKHRVTLRYLTREGFYIVQDKAREKKIDGVKYWQLFKLKEMATIPPPGAIHMTKKGKFVADAYYSEETGIVWATDSVTMDDFKTMVKVVERTIPVNGKDGKQLIDKDGNPVTKKVMERVIEDNFQPFTTQERALQAARVTRAMARKKKSLLETITQLATPIVLVFLLIMILVFWEDIYKPVQEQSKANAEIAKTNAAISEQNARMLSILSEGKAGNIPINQNIPVEGGG